jgi:hypothetical protein
MRFGTPPRPSEQGTGIAGLRAIAGSLGFQFCGRSAILTDDLLAICQKLQ